MAQFRGFQREIRSRFDEIVGFAGLEISFDAPSAKLQFNEGPAGFRSCSEIRPEILLVDEVLAE